MNNRELKFRVWCPSKNRWLGKSSHAWDEYCFKAITEPLSVCKRSSGEHLYDVEDAIIQQYTGLRDKNKKEIYEGDILRFGDLNYRVAWWDYKYRMECPYYVTFKMPAMHDLTYQQGICSEIIGNIFETPELINKKII